MNLKLKNPTEATNAKNATDVAKTENTKNLTQNTDVKSFEKETKNTLSDLQTKSEIMSKQISNLVETMRTTETNQAPVNSIDHSEKVWNRIRKYQANLKGVKLNLKE